MNFISLVGVEFRKIRRSKILLILLAAIIILWLPSVFNVRLNFGMQAEGISPEHSFFIQGFLGMTWFIFPASMVVGTVLISQIERTNHGILKMLALPIHTAGLCMAKFVVLLVLAAVQILMNVGVYFLSAVIVSQVEHYNFILELPFVLKEAGMMFMSAIPMLAFFWMLSVCIQTPIFSVGIGLASIVPSVLVINTKVWFVYPMAYPFFVLTSEYGKLATNLNTAEVRLFPWLLVAVLITMVCLLVACAFFGRAERK